MGIESKYIKNILELICDGDDEALFAKNQIYYLIENNIEYTGVGVFIDFKFENEINNYKIKNNDLVIGGVNIISEKYKIDALADLFFKNGIINYLEIWNQSGNNYPAHDIDKYTLKQIWEGSPGKIVESEDNN